MVSSGAELAYKFELPTGISDTIRSVQIHFSPSVNDASSDPFFLQIWEDSSSHPGQLIYTTDDVNLPTFYYPKYNLGVNGFCQYELPYNVPVSGTYYVGWRQSTANRLNVGFDKNINRQNDIFYKVGSGWNNTIFEGALMIRPVFVSPADNLVSHPTLKRKPNVKLYPNPTQDVFSVSTDSPIREIEVYDLQGRIVFSITYSDGFINVSDWDNGIYLVKVNFKNGKTNTQKLIVQH